MGSPMDFDLIVSRIKASQDGSPSVYVAFSIPSGFKAGIDRSPTFSPIEPSMMAFTSTEDSMDSLPKAMGGGGFVH